MWGDEGNAETVTINPWGVNQTNVWQGMGRNPGIPGTAGGQNVGNFPPPPANPAMRATPQQRPWDPSISNIGAPGGSWAPPVPQWAPIPPNQAAGWPMPQQQPWPANAPASYADQAKKSMMGGNQRQPNANQLPTGNAATNQPPPRFEVGAQNWGAKVDQGTPWDTGNPAQGPAAGTPGHDGSGKDWGQGGNRWNPPVPPPGAPGAWPPHPGAPGAVPPNMASNEWQPVQPQRHDPTGTSHWNAHPGAANAAIPAGVVPPPGNNWINPAPPMPANPDPVRLQYDPNPQTPGPWVPPGQTEMNNDMMWHDPNPKQKKVQRDTGTSIWGEPGAQRGEIRRWKMTENEDYTGVSSIAAPSGADWSNLPLNVGPPPGQAPEGQHQGAWGNQQGQQQNREDTSTSVDGTERWGQPQGQSSVNWGEVKGDEHERSDEFRQRLPTDISSGGSDLMDPMRQQQDRTMDGILTPQMAEQLQMAVNRGLINVSLLNHHAANQPLLVELHKRVRRLFEGEQKVAQLQRQQHQIPKFEQDQIFCAIENAKSEIAEFQRSLLGATANSMMPNGLSDGGSKLKQWKINQSNGMAENRTDDMINNIIGQTQALNIGDSKNSDDWKTGSLEWSPPVSGNDGLDLPKKSETHSDKNTPTPTDDGIPEFVPGKKWEWRDPNKVAEDPNATPGTTKLNPLLAASIGGSTIAASTNNGTSQANPTISTESHGTKPNTTGSGWNNGMGPASGFPMNDQWNKQRSPLMMAPPMMQRMPMPGMGMPPRQMPPFMNGFWVVFPLGNMADHQAHQICSRAGRLQNFTILPPKIACARYTEPNIDAVMNRLREQFMFGPNQVKILPDEEFEKMLRASGVRPGGGPPMPPMNGGWNGQQGPGVGQQGEPWTVDMAHHPPHGFQEDLQRPF